VPRWAPRKAYRRPADVRELRPVPSKRKPPGPHGALAEMMVADAELEGRPFGGWGGESLPPPEPVEVAPPARYVIPPPPWAEGGEQQADRE
jgi:hypothetical protein